MAPGSSTLRHSSCTAAELASARPSAATATDIAAGIRTPGHCLAPQAARARTRTAIPAEKSHEVRRHTKPAQIRASQPRPRAATAMFLGAACGMGLSFSFVPGITLVSGELE